MDCRYRDRYSLQLCQLRRVSGSCLQLSMLTRQGTLRIHFVLLRRASRGTCRLDTATQRLRPQRSTSLPGKRRKLWLPPLIGTCPRRIARRHCDPL